MIDKALLKKLNFIEIYQFFGGIVGILLMIYLLFTKDSTKYQDYLFVSIVLPFIFFIFCIYSAWLLNKKKYLRGLYLVFILLILQLVAFEFCGVFYTAVNGIAINFTLDLTNDLLTGFDLQPSQFFITFNGSSEIFHFKMNLFAFAMLFFIFKTIKEVKSSLYSIV
ncbi:hypothetical protein [Flavobacterium panacagri]|uniref:hypothetical protein n=1 Tax=Flavobacterium panacagri TaxID=3034146 RepID=UPI0025A654B8|nr:hypothetical protein [Flavobacterium panacagri]